MDEQKETPVGESKTTTYILVIVVLLAVVAWGIYKYYGQNKENNAKQNINQSDLNTAVAPENTPTPPSSGVIPKKMSYGEAKNTYPYRIQFSECHGNPGALAVKTGSIVMLDNRDSVAHTIVADKQTFKIAGFDYALLKTSAISNTNITCDGGGAALLNVQK